jgi:hypothetical protein
MFKASKLAVLPIWACYAATSTQHDDALRQPRNQAYARLQFRDLALFNSFSKSIRRTRQHLILSKQPPGFFPDLVNIQKTIENNPPF